MRPLKEKPRIQRGAAVVEFAVILPLLVVIVFGIIEFSVLLYDKAMVTNASRVGARVGIVATVDSWSVTEGKIGDAVNKYLRDQSTGNFLLRSLGNPSTITATTTVTRTGGSPGGTLTVTVVYNYAFAVIPNLITSITGTIPLSATTVMRFE